MFAVEWERTQVGWRVSAQPGACTDQAQPRPWFAQFMPAAMPAACLLSMCRPSVRHPGAQPLPAVSAAGPPCCPRRLMPLVRLQMRWFLDGQQYFAARSAGGSRQGGWWSDGPGAGPDSPFDRVGAWARGARGNRKGALHVLRKAFLRPLQKACIGRAKRRAAAFWAATAACFTCPGCRLTWLAMQWPGPASAPAGPYCCHPLHCGTLSHTRLDIACHLPYLQPFHLLLNLALGSEASEFTTEHGVAITEAQLQVSPGCDGARLAAAAGHAEEHPAAQPGLPVALAACSTAGHVVCGLDGVLGGRRSKFRLGSRTSRRRAGGHRQGWKLRTFSTRPRPWAALLPCRSDCLTRQATRRSSWWTGCGCTRGQRRQLLTAADGGAVVLMLTWWVQRCIFEALFGLELLPALLVISLLCPCNTC